MIKKYTGLQYLAIDIANNYSKDLEKQNFEVRLDWFENNKNILDTLVKDADEPNLYICGLQAYKDYLNGSESGYLISLDGCASGIAILSALMGCRKSAEVCGLISTDRQDAYTNIYHKLVKNDRLDRKDVKSAIMTSFYSSTAQPQKVFGKGELLDQFYATLEADLPGAYLLNKSIETLWNNKTLVHEWIMPDGFHVYIPVKEKVEKSFTFLNQEHKIIVEENKYSDNYRSLCANIVHSIDAMIIREMVRRCNYNEEQILNILTLSPREHDGRERTKDVKLNNLLMLQQETKFYSLEILEYIDEYNINLIDLDQLRSMIKTLPSEPFEILSIHDCIKCLPNYGNDVRQQYNNIMAEISTSNILQYIARTLTGNNKIVVDKIEDISNDIKNSEYALS
jgi:hypothetical protein